MHGGELQFGPVLARLPEHDVGLDLGANMERGGLDINHLHMDDADALQLDGALSVDAKGNLQKLKLDHFQARFPAAYDRYGQPWLNNAVAPICTSPDNWDGHLDYAADTWHSFASTRKDSTLPTVAVSCRPNGLHGAVDWSAQADKSPTTLAWNQLVVRRLAIGATQSHWHSHNGSLSLQSPFDMPILKGQAHITALDWRPTAARAQRLNLAANVEGVDMATLNQTFGWDAFCRHARWHDFRHAMDRRPLRVGR